MSAGEAMTTIMFIVIFTIKLSILGSQTNKLILETKMYPTLE